MLFLPFSYHPQSIFCRCGYYRPASRGLIIISAVCYFVSILLMVIVLSAYCLICLYFTATCFVLGLNFHLFVISMQLSLFLYTPQCTVGLGICDGKTVCISVISCMRLISSLLAIEHAMYSISAVDNAILVCILLGKTMG